jgi:hypothetical protein
MAVAARQNKGSRATIPVIRLFIEAQATSVTCVASQVGEVGNYLCPESGVKGFESVPKGRNTTGRECAP